LFRYHITTPLVYQRIIVVIRDNFSRLITNNERNFLYDITEEDDNEYSYHAKIILLKDEGRNVPEIRKAINECGVDGIVSRIHKRKSVKITAK
jgi:hypothetical protein